MTDDGFAAHHVGLRTGHWVMLDKPQEFIVAVSDWLDATATTQISGR